MPANNACPPPVRPDTLLTLVAAGQGIALIPACAVNAGTYFPETPQNFLTLMTRCCIVSASDFAGW